MTWGLAAGQILAFTRGNDGTVISVGRTGGANNPSLQFQVADASGATLNLATAQTLALAVSGTSVFSLTSSAITLSQPSTLKGLVTINAAAAGTSLLVNGLISTALVSITDGTQTFQVQTATSNVYSGSFSNHAYNLMSNNVSRVVILPAGNVTVNAPTSGNPLAVTALAAGTAQTWSDGTRTAQVDFSGSVVEFGSTSNHLVNLYANNATTVQLSTSTEAGIATPSTIGNLSGTTQIGYMDTPQVNITANASLALTHRGKSIYITGTTAGQTLTIPANGSVAFPVSTTIIVVNNSNQNWSVAITTDTLEWLPSAATGTRTLAAQGVMTLYKDTSTHWMAWGFSIS